MRKLFTILLLSSSIISFAQNNIKAEATKMGNALVNKDYKTFVSYSYPKILEQMGGTEKMAASIEQQMKGMENAGTTIVAISYENPSPIIKAGKELQCTIPQQMIMVSGKNKIAAKSTLICISKDNGKHWYFLDAGERDIKTIHQQLPNVSKSLVIPPPAQPVLLK